MELNKTILESNYEIIEDGIKAVATPNSNLFVDPYSNESVDNAPFFYEEVTGDFVLKARVSHDFVSTYDACVLLAYDNERLWAKACFEYTDYGTHSVVSVMTNGRSDDANSVDIEGNEVWLQLARRGNVFGIHYSIDGKEYRMARLANLPMGDTIKVGFVAQSPLGEGGDRYFKDIELKRISLQNIRNGNE